jgi:pimeloyl-ACP methyl ester carboxylesterase
MKLMTQEELDGKTTEIESNGLRFPVFDAGDGSPILLVHGFPDSRMIWRNVITPLLAAGHRVIAPDLRGMGGGPRLEQVEDYLITHHVADLVGIMVRLGAPRFRLVGHDFGGGIAWAMAAGLPDMIERLASISTGAPNPKWLTIEQRSMSWYFDFFQKTGHAEDALIANDWQLFHDLGRGQGDDSKFQTYLREPGGLTHALNNYRANTTTWGAKDSMDGFPPVQCPVMGVWGAKDFALSEGQMTGSEPLAPNGWRYERMENAGHWPMLDCPEELGGLLVDFMKD